MRPRFLGALLIASALLPLLVQPVALAWPRVAFALVLLVSATPFVLAFVAFELSRLTDIALARRLLLVAVVIYAAMFGTTVALPLPPAVEQALTPWAGMLATAVFACALLSGRLAPRWIPLLMLVGLATTAVAALIPGSVIETAANAQVAVSSNVSISWVALPTAVAQAMSFVAWLGLAASLIIRDKSPGVPLPNKGIEQGARR